MALKRWKWVWGPLLASVAVAVLTLPPAIPTERSFASLFGLAYSPWQYPPGRVHRAAVENAVRVQRWRLRQLLLADSILTVARGTRALRSADGAVTIAYEAPLSADSARVWLRAATAELDLYPKPASRGLPIVVALLSDPRRKSGPDDPYETLMTLRLGSEVTAARACIVTVGLPRRGGLGSRRYRLIGRGQSGEPVGRFLDLCALEGRFGRPGSEVSRWVMRGPNWYWRNDLLTLRLSEARRNQRRDAIGRSSQLPFWYGEATWVSFGCLDGTAALCARGAGLDTAGQRASLEYVDYSFGHGLLLARLLAQGTAQQFAAFWRSPRPVGEALQEAYRRPVGQLAYDAMSHWYYVAPGRSGAESRVVLAGLFWAGAALALALVVGRRWQTEI